MSIKQRYKIAKSVSQNIPLSQVDGGFPWLALAPLLAAAATPLASSAGKWVGQKIFGQGIRQAGMSGQGILRAGDMLAPQNRPIHLNPLMGPTKMSAAYVPRVSTAAMSGSGKCSKKGSGKGSAAMKTKMAALRALKKKK